MASATGTTDEAATPKKQQNAKITLYWLNKSRSQRILWMLEELGLEYELKTYKRQNMLAPTEMKEIHPLGKSPVLSIEADGMSKPLVLAESGVMVEYLIDHFGPQLAPKQRYQEGKEGQIGGETEEWLRYRYYMHYTEGSLMAVMVAGILVGAIRNGPVPFFIRPITNSIAGKLETLFLFPNFKTHFEFLESQISTSPDGGEFLCGKNLTGADIMMGFALEVGESRAWLTKEKYPKLWAYVDRIQGREAYKKAVQKIIDVEGSYDPTI